MSTRAENESVTTETRLKVERYESALRRLEDAKHQLNVAESERANAERLLAKFLIPKSAKPDETFSIWYGNRILTVVNSKDPAVIGFRE